MIGVLFFVTDSTWHLSGWNFIIHFSSQMANLSRSSWRVFSSDVTVMYAMVSSAKSLTVELMFSGMSLI